MRGLILGLTLALCGCTHRTHVAPPPGTLNYTVEHAKLRMVNCDSAAPPNCQHIYADYEGGSEELVATPGPPPLPK